VEFSVVVHDIKQRVLPPLDDDFAKDHGEYGSLEELKAAIRARLGNELKHIQDEALKEQVISRLLETHSFTPPPAMVERQTRYLMERSQNKLSGHAGSESESAPSMQETRKTLETRALRQVQATLLVEKISQLEQIEVPDKDVQARIDSLARAAGDHGKSVREIYSKPDNRDELRAQLVFDRTLNFLLERADIKEVDSSAFKVDEQGEKG
jgi:trigger factor